MTPEEAVKTASWVVVEGGSELLHLSNDSLELLYTCGIVYVL